MQQKTVNGIAFLVDPEDLELMKGRLWKAYNLGGKWYVQGLPDGQFLHRLLMGNPSGREIDHRNGDTLDNRRHNLREATHAQNIAAGRVRPSETGYRGVRRMRKTFQARIGRSTALVHLGTFPTAEDAARAYDLAAIERGGDFAVLNYPAEGPG